MKHFEYTLSTYPHNLEADELRAHIKTILHTEIENVLSGNNREVERRYKYFVDYT
jgi:hypothetical protein